MYIPNPNNIKVGYGYRLLGDDEIPQFNVDYILYGKRVIWETAIDTRYQGKTVNEIRKQYNGFYHPINFRRKIEIPEGYRLLDKNEIPGENYQYIIYHHSEAISICGKWQPYGIRSNGNKTVWDLYCEKDDRLDIHGVAYIEPISILKDSNITSTKIKDYNIAIGINMKNDNNENPELELEKAKKEQEIAEQKQLAAKNRIVELEKIIKDKKDKEIKVGDYVTPIDSQKNSYSKEYQFLKVTKIAEPYFYWDDTNDGNFIGNYRKATNEEIEKYLLDKAAKDGWIVGAKFKRKDKYAEMDGNIYTVEKLTVYNGESGGWSDLISEYWNEKKEPFVTIWWNCSHNSPMAWTELVKDDPITITVDGTTYQAKFYNSYVNFGCANISRRQIVNALEFINKENSINQEANRKFESIKIGKGEFTIELLTKLNKKFKELYSETPKFKKGDWVVATHKSNGCKWKDAYRFDSCDGNNFKILCDNCWITYSFSAFDLELAPENYPKHP